MKKIPSVFVRDWSNKACPATTEVDPDCAWVLAGDGVATEKFDGTACLVRGGSLYKRHKLKRGYAKPDGWIHWSFDESVDSGHGWLPVGDRPDDRWHRDGFGRLDPTLATDGTYELVGPKIQSNPYGLRSHELWRHGATRAHSVSDCPRDFEGIYDYLRANCMEGVVFHHPDGRMAKVKRIDFGIQWPDFRCRAGSEDDNNPHKH